MGDGQQSIVKAAGLYTFPNELSEVPPGALLIADNVVILADGIIQSRRGFGGGTSFGAGSTTMRRLFPFQNIVLGHDSGSKLFRRDTGGAWSTYPGTYAPFDSSTRLRGVEANQNIYFPTSTGVYKLDSTGTSQTPKLAGAPRGLDGVGALTGSTGSVFSGSTSGNAVGGAQVAYRVVWGYKDQNANLVLGAPSSRTIVQNPSAAAAIGKIVRTSAASTATGVSRAASTVTVVTAAAHGFLVGQTVNQVTTGQANFPTGVKTIVTVADSTHFTYTEAGAAATSTSALTYWSVKVTTTAVNAFAAGQTVNLQPGETNFPAGNYVIGLIDNLNFSVTDASTNAVSSTAAQTFARQCDVILTIYVPTYVLYTAGVPAAVGPDSSYFYQVYRTAQAVDMNTDPGDEGQLVFEAPFSGPFSVTTASRVTNVTTLTTAAAHGLVTGDVVRVEVYPTDVNFVYSAPVTVASTPSTTTFTIADANANASVSGRAWPGVRIQLAYTDQIPDALRQASLYTAPSQEGILNANTLPPIAKDVALFKGSTFYANTLGKQRLKLSLLGVGGTSGLATTDAFLIGTSTWTADTSAESDTLQHFQLFTAGTPSQNIANTVKSLCKMINRSTAKYWAYYVSGPNDMPGNMLLEEREIGGAAFTATVSVGTHGSAWQPAIPASGTSVSSSADRFKNGLYWSKSGQPESVPLTNYQFVGSGAVEIRRVVPIRNSLFIFTDQGLYQLTGDTAPYWTVSAFDPTVNIVGPECATTLENAVYALTSQGVISASESGVQIVSRPIEGDLRAKMTALGMGAGQTTTNLRAFAVAYESDREFILWMQSASGDNAPQFAYVYNVVSRAWTRWTFPAGAACIDPNADLLVLGDATNGTQFSYVEQKALTATDFADNYLSATSFNLTSAVGKVLTFAGSPASAMAAGDLLWDQSSNKKSIISSIVGSVVNVETVEAGWTTGGGSATSYFYYPSIRVNVQWAPIVADLPGVLKQFSEISLLARDSHIDSLTVGVASDISTTEDTFTVKGPQAGAWGTATFGAAPWFTSGTSPVTIRTYVPRQKQRANDLRVRIAQSTAWAPFVVRGLAVVSSALSSRGAGT